MRIRPTREDRAFATEIFRRYKAKEGSEFIAREVSLAHLSAILRLHRPRVVLECGAGIGTITDALLNHECGVARVVSTEQNDFCLTALAKNLSHHDSSRFEIVTDASELPAMSPDMIIGDGNKGRHDVFSFARLGTIVFVDGVRDVFRNDLAEFLKSRGLSISFRQYGARYGLKQTYFPRFRLHAVKWAKLRKGCWIGEVTARAESWSG